MPVNRILSILIAAVLVAGLGAAAEPRTTWDLTEMFPTHDAFLEARAAVAARIPEIGACRGTLGQSADVLQRCLELGVELDRAYSKVAIYAFLAADKDLRDPAGQQMRAETQRIGVELGTAMSWVQPEILSVGAEKIESFIAAAPGLEPYTMLLRDTLGQAEHTLPPEEEELLSSVGLIAGKFSDVYGQLSTSDMPYPTVELPGLGEIKLDQAGYIKHRGSENPAVREQVFTSFWTAFAGYESTFGTLLNAEITKNWLYARTRSYESSLEAALSSNDIPVEVYTSLIRDVRANLPVLHRMLKLRQRILGLDILKYSDIYASIVPEVDAEYSWQEAKPIVLGALAPLGEDYVAQVAKGLDSWADVYPADGKRSGAYSAGSWYDGHPWVLLNYNDSFDSVSTTAHEFGHAMHSWRSNRAQPYPKADYSIMAAEVASTFNEALLKEHLLASNDDPTFRMAVLGNFLESFRQTVFRQTMFAEFELEAHRRVEAGEALTGASLSELYLRLLREYHGHDQGVMTIDDLYGIEWAFIPHFYRRFYVYQYATGLVASTALAEKVLAGEPGAAERYLAFLASGGSDYPVNELRRAGVDLTTPAPFATAIGAVNRAMDEIEKLLAAKEAQEGAKG
jgi:oligoendopeptidase F